VLQYNNISITIKGMLFCGKKTNGFKFSIVDNNNNNNNNNNSIKGVLFLLLLFRGDAEE
jgi:hypothetical protein